MSRGQNLVRIDTNPKTTLSFKWPDQSDADFSNKCRFGRN
jgi:hypothetical protein